MTPIRDAIFDLPEFAALASHVLLHAKRYLTMRKNSSTTSACEQRAHLQLLEEVWLAHVGILNVEHVRKLQHDVLKVLRARRWHRYRWLQR